ncbi:response regulator transcription factor [Nocardiopsis sediminis]|uniref:Response regulator transcription factor n=1 Tax=Nocardiopsis sediminis TaxID=1778267 RepID=A0ABV8FHL0_9ACTN
MGNELQRFGIERMLQSLTDLGDLRVCSGPVEAAAAIGPHTDLIVALREIDAAGAAALRQAAERGAEILVLVDDDDLGDLGRLADIPGSGFLSIGDLDTHALRDALLRVRVGEVPMSPRLARGLMAKARETPARAVGPSPAIRLTPRERQVMVLLVDGLSNKQIARRLGISVHGAKRLVANILAKLDCATRTLAVAKALQEGIYQQYMSEDRAG